MQILLSSLLNGILSGLVSITACCATVEVEGAFLVGAGSAVVYHAGDQLMLKLGVWLGSMLLRLHVASYCS